MLRVVMWSTDPVGKQMAGPGIRYHRLATELAERFEVTLVAPGEGIPERAVHVPFGRVRDAPRRTWRRTSSSRRACRSASSGACAGRA